MAYPLSVNDLVEVKSVQKLGAQQALMVWHYRVTATTGASRTDADLVEAISAAFAPKILACQSQKARLQGFMLQIIKPTRRVEITYVADAGDGGIVGDALPSQIAGVITLYTLIASRSKRGRKFVPFPGEASSDDIGKPNAGYLANLAALATQFEASFTVVDGADTATVDPVVYSRKLDSNEKIVGSTFRSYWHNQRRREQTNSGGVIIDVPE